MGENINTVSGARVYIGTTTAATTVEDFQGDSYTEIGEIEDIGEYGDQNELVTFTAINVGRVQKLKGTADAGDFALVVGADATDQGQAALIAAQAEKFSYNFKIVYDDAITLGGDGSEEYFRGLVMSKRRVSGTANNVLRRSFMIAINSEVLEQSAS